MKHACYTELAEAGQVDRYRFQANQGQLLTAHAQRAAGVSLEPGLSLIDPSDAREMGRGALGQGEVTVAGKLASGGMYTLAVSGGGSFGPYVVSLSLR